MTRATLALLLVVGCATPTGAQKAQTIQTALAAGKLACLTLRNDPTVPRETDVDEYCRAVLEGCAK